MSKQYNIMEQRSWLSLINVQAHDFGQSKPKIFRTTNTRQNSMLKRDVQGTQILSPSYAARK
jgi:hypothetical protein